MGFCRDPSENQDGIESPNAPQTRARRIAETCKRRAAGV
jgi:hypothetical protein